MSFIQENVEFCFAHPNHESSSKSLNTNAFQAAFQPHLLWPNDSEIKISFVNDEAPKGFYQYTTEQLYHSEVNTPDGSMLDPLESVFKDRLKYAGIPGIQSAIRQIIEERFQPYLNLKFKFVSESKEDADITIEFAENKGTSSNIGIQSSRNYPSMVFSWFSVQTVIHEFCHALGMIHEHQNPRGEQIKWNVPEVIKYLYENCGVPKENAESSAKKNIINPYKIDETNGSEFDPHSVMLYSYPSNLTMDKKGVFRCLRLSQMDVAWLAEQYSPSQEQLNKGHEQLYERIKEYQGKVPHETKDLPTYEEGRLTVGEFLKWVYPDQYGNEWPFVKEQFELPNKNNFIWYVIIFLIIVSAIVLVFFLTKKKRKGR